MRQTRGRLPALGEGAAAARSRVGRGRAGWARRRTRWGERGRMRGASRLARARVGWPWRVTAPDWRVTAPDRERGIDGAGAKATPEGARREWIGAVVLVLMLCKPAGIHPMRRGPRGRAARAACTVCSVRSKAPAAPLTCTRLCVPRHPTICQRQRPCAFLMPSAYAPVAHMCTYTTRTLPTSLFEGAFGLLLPVADSHRVSAFKGTARCQVW
ncbi:MAG: hypothetical protein J3K34DRAFT_30405 [Monoraphidium minutum]|nr:MAG: hypothetical protein J3K34DRAFT_30405 [Monoraphidium minutum]